MATDQEILKARTFRVAESMKDSEYSAADADWHRTKMRTFLNAYRYVQGSLELVWLFPARGQDYLEHLTPWEREWSVLARSYAGGFTPIVDENGTVIAHRGVTGTYDATPLMAPYGDLLYTLPDVTLKQTFAVDPALKTIGDVGVTGQDLLQLLKDGASVFVHHRAKTLPPDWRRLRYVPAETKLTLVVSVDGELYDFVSSATGFLKEGYYPMDFLALGQVLATLGKQGTRFIKALVRKGAAKGEGQLLLAGPLSRRKTSPGMAVSTGGVLPTEHLNRRTFILGEDLPIYRGAGARPVPGFYDVVIHGDSTGFHILLKTKPDGKQVWTAVSVREVADAIRPRLAPGDKIRLLACETGHTGGPAQQLANELNRTVWAPSTKTYIDPVATGKKSTSLVPLDGGKFYEFVPQGRGAAKLVGGGKATGNELQGEIVTSGKK